MPVKVGSAFRRRLNGDSVVFDHIKRLSMPNFSGIAFAVITLAIGVGEASAQGRPTRFWNLTQHTISEFSLAPAGTTKWGPNQCKNDKDGTVDTDERLRITGVAAGTYDAKLTDVSGRVCVVRNIKVEEGQVFSIEEKELTSCNR
jgi:hypothetical protein